MFFPFLKATLKATLEAHSTCLLNQNDVFQKCQKVRPIFSTRDNSPVQGICVPKSNPYTFWYFCQKNGSKQPKMGVKSPGLVWYGLVLSS